MSSGSNDDALIASILEEELRDRNWFPDTAGRRLWGPKWMALQTFDSFI